MGPTLEPSLPAALCAAHSAGILVTHGGGAILRFSAPQGRHVAPIGVKLGVEKSIKGRLLFAKFRPNQCRGGGVGHQN